MTDSYLHVICVGVFLYFLHFLLEQNDKNSIAMKQEMLMLQEMLNALDYRRKVGERVSHLFVTPPFSCIVLRPSKGALPSSLFWLEVKQEFPESLKVVLLTSLKGRGYTANHGHSSVY